MNHKYLIEKIPGKKELILKEFAELEKENFTLLNEETYPEEKIADAVTKGKDAMIAALRTSNMYPPDFFINKIIESVLTMFGPNPVSSCEVIIDDIDLITKQRVKRKVSESIEEEEPEIEDLLDDDFEEEFDEKTHLKKIDSPLKIIDDDYEDFSDDEK